MEEARELEAASRQAPEPPLTEDTRPLNDRIATARRALDALEAELAVLPATRHLREDAHSPAPPGGRSPVDARRG